MNKSIPRGTVESKAGGAAKADEGLFSGARAVLGAKVTLKTLAYCSAKRGCEVMGTETVGRRKRVVLFWRG